MVRPDFDASAALARRPAQGARQSERRRGAPKRRLGGLALVAAGALAACARAPARPSAVGMQRALELAPSVALCVPPEAAALALALAAPLALERLVLACDAPGQAPPGALRIVVAAPGSPGIEPYCAALGLELRADGFEFAGRTYVDAQDGLLATFEDPLAPGCPASFVFARDPATALAFAADLEPTWRPSFRTFRQGTPERRGSLHFDGALDAASVVELGFARAGLLAGGPRAERAGFTFKVGPGVAGAWDGAPAAAAGLAALERARRALEDFWPADEAAREAQASILLTLFAHLEDKLRATDDGRAASLEPVGLRVYFVDGADGWSKAVAVWLEAALVARCGAVDATWARAALAVELADQWWGTPLGAWLARLERAGLVPSARALADRAERGSEHVLAPARAGLVRFLRQREGGDELVRELCAGGELAGAEALEAEWRAWLAELALREPAPAPRRAALAARDFWRGLHVLPEGAAAPGYATRSADESLRAARATGADALAFAHFVESDAGREAPSAFGRSAALELAGRDTALAHALAEARALGCATYLRAHVLAGPSTTWQLAMPQQDAAGWARAYAAFEQGLVHAALVAELAGVDLLGIGGGLARATVTRAASAEPLADPALDLRRAAWTELAARTRSVFDGALTYSAGDVGELVAIEFWSHLDFVGLDIYVPLVREEDPGVRLTGGHLEKRFANTLERLVNVGLRNQRPVLVTDIGLPSAADAWADPRWLAGPVDLAAQSEAVRAWREALRGFQAAPRLDDGSPALRGAFLFRWTTDPAGGGAHDRSWTLQNKPAALLLPELFE